MLKQTAREMLDKAYDEGKDADVSRRMLLFLKVRCYGVRPSHAAADLFST